MQIVGARTGAADAPSAKQERGQHSDDPLLGAIEFTTPLREYQDQRRRKEQEADHYLGD